MAKVPINVLSFSKKAIKKGVIATALSAMITGGFVEDIVPNCMSDLLTRSVSHLGQVSAADIPNGITTATSYSQNVIPIMTSATSPSGIVTSSDYYTNIQDWKAFDGNRSYYDGSGYHSWGTHNTTGWLAYEFTTPKTIAKYVIDNTSTSKTWPTDSPKDWTFEAWDDTNGKWVILDKQTGVKDWSVPREFVFTNNTPYKKYRINVTANNGTTTGIVNLAINELQMMEAINPVLTPINLSINSGSQPLTGNTIILSGSASGGNNSLNVSATINGVIKTAAVDENGNWSLTWNVSDIPDGIYTNIPITVTDSKGSTKTINYTGTITVNKTPAIDPYLDAKNAVSKAESTKIQADIDAARILVNAMPAGADKDALISRLNAINATSNNGSNSSSDLLKELQKIVPTASLSNLEDYKKALLQYKADIKNLTIDDIRKVILAVDAIKALPASNNSGDAVLKAEQAVNQLQAGVLKSSFLRKLDDAKTSNEDYFLKLLLQQAGNSSNGQALDELFKSGIKGNTYNINILNNGNININSNNNNSNSFNGNSNSFNNSNNVNNSTVGR